MFYSFTHTATVGVKGLTYREMAFDRARIGPHVAGSSDILLSKINLVSVFK